MTDLSRWYASLQPRERRFVLIGALAAVLLLLVGVFMPLQRARTAAQQRVERKRADLAWVSAVAPQLTAAQASVPASSQESLVVLADRVAREAGLSQALSGSQPSGDGGLSVRMQQAPFDTLVAWISRLGQRYGVRVDSATIDNTSTPGVVNASIVLRNR